MGALAGNITATTYYVEGDLPADFRDRFLAALGRRAFREIEIEGDADESLGWVTVNDPFDTAFDLNKVLWGDYFMATLRHDAIRIPPAIFKLHLRKAVADYQAQTGKERITRAEEDEVRDHLQKQLRKRVLPAVKTYDFVWNIQRGLVWLFTTNKRVNEVFDELWCDTFELRLVPKSAYALLERMGDENLLERVLAVEPALLTAPLRATEE